MLKASAANIRHRYGGRMAIASVASRVAEAGVWGAVAIALAYFVGTGDWISAAIVIGLVGAGILATGNPKLMVILWFVGQPTIFVLGNNAVAGVPFFTIERALFALLLLLMIATALTRGNAKRPLDRLEWVVVGFVTILTVSFLSTAAFKDLNAIRNDLALLIQVYMMPWLSILIARRMDWTEKDVAIVLRLLTIVGLFLVAIGVLQFVFKVSWFKPQNIEVIHVTRTTGTFANAVEYGSVVGAAAIMTMAQFVCARGAFFKGALLACAGAMIGAVVLCLTRSPLVGLAVAFVFLFANDRRIRFLFVAGLAVAPFVSMVLMPAFVDADALANRLGETEPIYNRLALLATAWTMVLTYPIFGFGFGRHAFSENNADYLTDFGGVSAQWAYGLSIPHLEYLHIAVLTGLLGLGFYLWAWLELLRLGRRIHRDPTASPFIRTASLYATAVIISLMVNGLFVDFIAYNYAAAMALLMISIISQAARNPRSAGGSERG